MTPVHFKQANMVFAKDQPQYNPLPAFADDDGTVVTCWRLSWRERLRILFSGRFWLITMTFKAPLQPILPTIDNPITTP